MKEDKHKKLFLQAGAACMYFSMCILNKDWPWPKFSLPVAIAAICGAIWQYASSLPAPPESEEEG